MKNLRSLTLTSFAYFFLCGFFVNIGGAVSGQVALDLGTGTAAVGYCFSAFMAGRLLGILGNGLLVHRPPGGKNLYVRLAPLAALAAAAALASAGNLFSLAASLLCAGVAVGWLYSLSNFILVDARRGPEKAFYISAMNFLFSVGGVASPFLAGVLLERGLSWRHPYLLFGALCLLALALAARADYRPLFAAQGDAERDEGRLGPRHAVLCAAMVAYILAEYSISYWTPAFLREERGASPLFAASCVSAFWLAMLGGRLLHSLLIRRIRPRPYLAASGAAAVLSVLFLGASRSDASALAATVLAGLSCAGLFPSLFALGIEAGSKVKKTFPTLLMLSAATGSLLAMPLGSAVKTLAGAAALPFAPASALAIMILLVLASRRAPSSRRSPNPRPRKV